MNNSINLISSKNEQVERELKVLLFVRVVAVSMLISLAFIAILAFIISTQIPLSKIKQDESQTLSSISALHNRLTAYYLVKDRINNVKNIIATRKDFSKPIDLVISEVPTGVSINNLSIDKDILVFDISSDSLIPLNKIIDDIFAVGNKGKIIKNVKLNSLGLDGKGGKYSLALQFETL